MVNRMSVGQYIPHSSIIHSLDARTKIIATIVLLVLIVIASFPYKLIFMALFIAILMIISAIPIHLYMQALRPFVPIIAITALLQLLLVKGTIITTILGINITLIGVNIALAISIRLILLLIVIRILTATTTPSALMSGVGKLLLPFGYIGLPVEELVMIMTISLRFIPLFFEEAIRLQQAQISRGISFRTGNITRRVKGISSLLVPLLRISFTRALEIATAMEARCYNGGKGRTYLYVFKLRMADYLSMVGLLVLLIFILV